MRLWQMLMASQAGVFSPSDLFAGGEFGAWYDPSDYSTMWQDTGGTTPITGAGQLVARIDDKSGNGINLTQSNSSLRPTTRTSGDLKYLEFADPDYMNSSDFTDDLLIAGSGFVAASTSNADDLGWTCGEYETISVTDRIYICHDTRTNRLGIVYGPTGSVDTILYNSEMDVNPHVVGYVDEGSTSRLYVDGTAQTDTGTPTASFSVADRRIALGDRSQFDGQFAGDVYGVVLIDRELTSTEISDLNTWLSNKAGI